MHWLYYGNESSFLPVRDQNSPRDLKNCKYDEFLLYMQNNLVLGVSNFLQLKFSNLWDRNKLYPAFCFGILIEKRCHNDKKTADNPEANYINTFIDGSWNVVHFPNYTSRGEKHNEDGYQDPCSEKTERTCT